MTTAKKSSQSAEAAALLATISSQLRGLTDRMPDDIDRYANDPEAGGFVIYYLTDPAGEPLKNTALQKIGLAVSDIEQTEGFGVLRDACETLSVNLRIEEHFYSEDPVITTIYRVVVDGWS